MSEGFALVSSISFDIVVIRDLIYLVLSVYILVLCGFEEFYENSEVTVDDTKLLRVVLVIIIK